MPRDDGLRREISRLRELPDYTGDDEVSSARIESPLLGKIEVPLPRGAGRYVGHAVAVLVLALAVAVVVWALRP